MRTMDRVRQVGFEVAYRWFTTEAASTTFVLKHQDEVCRTVDINSTDAEIGESWLQIRNQYLSIPEELIKPSHLANSLIR